jgi:hypothetical protein
MRNMKTSTKPKTWQQNVKIIEVEKVKDLPDLWFHIFCDIEIEKAMRDYVVANKKFPKVVYRYKKFNGHHEYYIPSIYQKNN